MGSDPASIASTRAHASACHVALRRARFENATEAAAAWRVLSLSSLSGSRLRFPVGEVRSVSFDDGVSSPAPSLAVGVTSDAGVTL